MPDLIVIVPTRGRPDNAATLAEDFQNTCTASTELWFAVDQDDPKVSAYQWVAESQKDKTIAVHVGVVPGPSNMVHALNQAAGYAAAMGTAPFALGFMGDDHRPRTRGWDASYLESLRALGTGIVYGNDMLQGRRLPTQCAMTTDIVRALGFMAPPALVHLYVDNYWLSLGEQAQCITYLPEVIVEHHHPVAGKAEWDEGYARVNNPELYGKDQHAFAEYCRSNLLDDVQKVEALRGVHA